MKLSSNSWTLIRGAIARRGQHSTRGLSTLPRYEEMQYGNPLNVPRLPVPSLDHTINHYLSSIKPLVSPEQYAEHEKLVRDFESTDAKWLNEKLVQRTKKQEEAVNYPYSYIEEDWDAMYLAGRYSIPINSNPGYGFIDETNPSEQKQASRAAKFTLSALKWMTKLQASQLEPDKGPQCVSQYPLQFGTGRVAKKGRDVLEFNPKSKHVVVVRGPRFYKVEVRDGNGNQLSEDEFAKKLQQIIDLPKVNEPSVGILTTQERDEWAKHRATLEADPTSKASLKAIDSALLLIVLEDKAPKSKVEKSTLLLHGSGVNRWFDKHQLIVMSDGQMGVNFEHSFSDGMTWNRWIHEAWHDMHGTDSGFSALPQPKGVLASTKNPEVLKFNIPDSVHSGIKSATDRFKNEVSNCKSYYLDFDHYGKSTIKTWKISPDAVAQLSFQLAFFRLHGSFPPTYESCAVRTFLHGRTETIRSCTSDAAAFVRSVLNKDDKSAQKAAFQKAAARHIDVAKLAQKGWGCDRHLLALSSIAVKESKVHPFFKDPIRLRSGTWRISSSNVTTPLYDMFNFGPVAEDGYGIGYLIFDENIPVNITNFKSHGETDSERLAKAIEESLLDIQKFHS